MHAESGQDGMRNAGATGRSELLQHPA